MSADKGRRVARLEIPIESDEELTALDIPSISVTTARAAAR